MFKINMVLSDMRDACGVEESVENYQSYLVACCAVMVFESYEIHCFFFALSFVSLMIFLLIYAFTHIFFTAL